MKRQYLPTKPSALIGSSMEAARWLLWMAPLLLTTAVLGTVGCAATNATRDGVAIINGWHTDAFGPQVREDCWRQQGKTVPLPESMSCVGGFAGALGITKDMGFFGEWNKVGELADLPEQDVVRAGEEIIPAIIFSGAGADEQGMAQVTYDVMLTKPDGSPVGAKSDVRCWIGLPSPDQYDIELCEQYAQFKMAPGSAPGKYMVTVYIRDHVKKNMLRLIRKVEYAP